MEIMDKFRHIQPIQSIMQPIATPGSKIIMDTQLLDKGIQVKPLQLT